MKDEFTIVEKFEITGRGAVVVISEITKRIAGREYEAEVTGVNGDIISTKAFKELFLRRMTKPIEKEAYMLKDVHKQDISDNATISFL